MSITFKIFFSESNIRRISLTNIPTFGDFIGILKDTYPSFFHTGNGNDGFTLKYFDSENDKIGVSSQIEWEEMICETIGNGIVKIYLEKNVEEQQKKNGGFKKSNREEFNFSSIFEESNGKEFDFKSIFNQLLNGFDGFNLESHGEDFDLGSILNGLDGFIKVVEVPSSYESPYPFWGGCRGGKTEGRCGGKWRRRELMRKFWKLHQLSLECLDSKDRNVIQKGKEYLLEMLEIIPNHHIAVYNLACAESLLGNIQEAILSLETAIDAGYHDLEHMLNDKDFDNIKDSEGFKLLVTKLENILGIYKVQNEKKEEYHTTNPFKKDLQNEQKISQPRQPEIIIIGEQNIEKNTFTTKLDALSEIFTTIPRDTLKNILYQCQENIERAVEMIYQNN